MAKTSRERHNNKIRRNYFIIALLLGVVVISILVRAGYTYFAEGDVWRQRGQAQIKPNIMITAPRGNIYASDGRLMATSEYRYRLYVDFWADGIKKDTLMKYIKPLSVELNRMFPERSADYYHSHILKGWKMREKEAKQINAGKRVAKKSREYRLLNREINYLELKEIKTLPYFNQGRFKSGLITKSLVKRTKPYGTLASRTIGDIYGEFEKGGKNGLELEYDSILRGIPGTSTRRKVSGRIIDVTDVEPVSGKDIISTIDIDIQDMTEKALLNKLREIDAESGTAVVMEVKTGEIKAITNMGRIREGVWGETKNHAVADESEPGSTFKVASMMVALEDGVINPNDLIDVGNGTFMYANRQMTDHNANRGGYGTITAAQSIWYSSNIGVAKIILKGYENNPGKFVEGLYKIGLNSDLNLEIPGSGRAKIRTPKDKHNYWSKTTLPWMSFGYETQIPPIYTLTFFNAIANEGKMIRPIFVKEIHHNGEKETEQKTTIINERICSEKTLSIIRQMLIDVVEKGTAANVKSDYITIAGKTGTAQISQGAAGYKAGGKSHQVSFCGYFPTEDPIYSCIVVIRKPRNGYPSGGLMAGGVFKQIAEEINARLFHTLLDEVHKDSINPIIPKVKNGHADYTLYALDELKIPCKNHSENEWVLTNISENKVNIKDLKLIENLVPNVEGMGARDAVFLLENAGLKVNLSGKGIVKNQSIPPGERIKKGQTIKILLN